MYPASIMEINLRTPGEGKGYEERKIIKMNFGRKFTQKIYTVYATCRVIVHDRPGQPKLKIGTITKNTSELYDGC